MSRISLEFLKGFILTSSKKAATVLSIIDCIVVVIILIVLMIFIWGKRDPHFLNDIIFLKQPFALFCILWTAITVIWRGRIDIIKYLSSKRSIRPIMWEGFLSGMLLFIIYEISYFVPLGLNKLGFAVRYQTKIELVEYWWEYFLPILKPTIICGCIGLCVGLFVGLLNRFLLKRLSDNAESVA